MFRHVASRPELPMLTILALLLSLLATVALPMRAAAATELLAELSGAEEVPGPGDDDGFGFANLYVDPDVGEICVFLEVLDIAQATAAHIHAGAAGVAGDVVVTLPTPGSEGYVDGCVDGLDGPTLQAILDDPAGYYVNVHNADFPAGAVRGQLGAPPVYRAATLSGTAEVPGPGDPDGNGFADLAISVADGEICGAIGVGNIATATAAHIHQAAPDAAGPVVVTLWTPDENGFGEGCVGGIDAGILEALIATPRDFYVNVHNAEYPDGAVRGQLDEPPITLFALLSGDTEVPGPGDPDGSGSAQLDFFVESARLCATVRVADIAPATAAHIHAGAEGVAGDVVITLPTPGADGMAEGCVEGLDPTLLDAILGTIEGYYVNVHTADSPAGAVRGQLTFEAPPPPCEDGELCTGELAPGTYTYRGFGTDLTFTTTTPWFFESTEIPAMALYDFEQQGALTGFPFLGEVFTDPCDFESAGTIGDSPSDLITWVHERSFLDTSEPIAVSYGGADGYQLDLQGVNVPADCAMAPWVLMFVLPIYGDWHFETGSTGRLVALDVAGETILFISEHVEHPELEGGVSGGDPAAEFLERAWAVVESFEWALGGLPPTGGGGATPAPSLPNTSVLESSGSRDGSGLAAAGLLGAVAIGSALLLVVARDRQRVPRIVDRE